MSSSNPPPVTKSPGSHDEAATAPGGILNEDNKIGGNDIGGNLDCADKNSVIDFTSPNVVTDSHVKTGDCSGAPANVVICHTGQNTLSVPENAVPGHIAHGDVLGACEN